MTAKEFLHEPGRLYKQTKRLEERYIELFERATSPRSALNLGDGLGITSSYGNARERLLVRLADAKQKYINSMLEYIECRQDTFNVLVDIKGPAGDILIERYIELKKWDDVRSADSVNMSEVQAFRCHEAGLKIVETKLKEAAKQ